MAFLDTKQPGWRNTQTVAPTGLSTSGATTSSLTVNWTPITYTADSGYYRVSYSTSPGGPYTPFATTTANKSASSLTVTGLAPNTTYHFVVETTTLPHGFNSYSGSNSNTVVSDVSSEASGATSGAPAATATVSGGGTICAGGSVQIQAALTGTPPWSLTWSDGATQNGVATSPATRTVSPPSSTVYTVTAVSDAHGAGTSSGSANVTVHPKPTAAAGGSATICPGGSAPLSGSGGASCSWSPSSGLSNASSCSPSASPSSTTTYTLTVTSAAGCVSSNAPTVTVTVAPTPATPSIAAPGSANPNQSGLSASVASHAGSSYAWGITNGAITSGNGSSAITFTAAASGTILLTVVETSSAGCASAQATRSIAIVESAGTATVSGSASICQGASTQIRADLTGTPPWSLTWSDGVAQTGLAESPVFRTVGPSVTTIYILTAVSDANGPCVDSGEAVVTVHPVPATPVITAPASAKPGQAGLVASVAGHPGTSCTWMVTNGVLTSGQGTAVIALTAGASGSVTLRVVEKSAAGCSSAEAFATIPIEAGCDPPGALAFLSPPAEVPSGQTAGFTWSAATGLAAGGSYVLETSRDAFATLDASIATTSTSAILPTSASGGDVTLTVRVRAVQACGASTASAAVHLLVKGTPASFVVTRGGPAWTVVVGEPPPSAEVTFRNVGGLSGRLSLTGLGGFFSVTPAVLDLAAGEDGSATLTVIGSYHTHEGDYHGLLAGDFGASRVETPVSLRVAATPSPQDAVISASTSSVVFSAPAGANPQPRTFTIRASARSSTAPISFEVAVGPGGSWLTVFGAVADPLPQGTDRELTLFVSRNARSADEGAPPLRTLVRITPIGGDPLTGSAVIEVVDTELTSVDVGGGGRLLSPSPLASPGPGGSFIVPTAVKATSGLNTAQVFVSDGWLKNLQSTPVPAELYFTPEGVNGLSDPAVRRVTTTLGPGQTFRLSDLVSTVFQTSSTSGQVEVRSPSAFALSLRTTTESIVAGDPRSRFGSEIPGVGFGAGVGVDDGELVVPGVDDDERNRANLILAETTGAAATVVVAVHDAQGQSIGELTRAVPPYGKVQVNGLVAALAPGRALSGGWAGIRVTGGSGKVVPLATVIDNRSGSFSAVLGKGVTAPQAGRSEPLSAARRYVVPTAVRTTGAFDTRFVTALSLVNGTSQAAVLTLSYTCYDQDDGNQVKTVSRPLVIPPRGALPKEVGADVIANLFGMAGRSYGYLTLEGDVSRIVAVASVSAQVDPNDAGKGLKTAQVDGFQLSESQVMGRGLAERRFAGAEKSFQRRTNLILLEVAGEPCEVRVRMNGPGGARLAEASYRVAAGQYLQVNDVFGPAGLNLGDGPFQNVEITAAVTQGNGRVVALATVNDNISRNPQIFTLLPPGPAAPSIGF